MQVRHKRCWFNPWIGKIPWRRAWQSTPVFLPRESHGQRSLERHNSWGHKETEAHNLSYSQLLFLLTVESFSIFGYKEYNQSDFSIDHLVMFMCRVIPCMLEECVCYDECVLLAKLCCSASFCTPTPNLPVTPGITWLPTFAFQPAMMKRTSFLVLVLEGLVGLHRTVQLLQHY